MADETPRGMKVAILVTDGFEQVKLTEPRKALDQAGGDTQVVLPKGDEVRGWNFTDWGQSLQRRPRRRMPKRMPGRATCSCPRTISR